MNLVRCESDNARHVFSWKRTSKFRIALAHFTEHLTVHSLSPGVLGIRSETHRNFSGFQIEGDLGRFLLIGFRRIQVQRCAERRMSSKWQLMLDREDADSLSFACFSGGVPRENKGRF